MVQIGSSPGPIDKLEAKIAGLLDMPEAILLPSARFGIWAGLKIAVPAHKAVAVPVLNCSAVFEAAIRSGQETVFVDCEENSLLMDLNAMPAVSACVLSELYGQTYELSDVSSLPPFCILDMAMTIPEKHLLKRLRPSDLGLFSFGLGKSGYAGWGGVALTQDKNLARELHDMVRVSCLADVPSRMNVKRTLALGARIVAHWKPFYRFARKIQELRLPPAERTVPDRWFHDGTQGEEWRRLPVRPELQMLAHNFRNFEKNAAIRRELEKQYRRLLQSSEVVKLPASSLGVLSHFSVRIPASMKELTQRSLWKHGIDTGDVIGFPSYFNPSLFPNAFKASQELVNLPMDRGVAVKHILSIAAILRKTASRNSQNSLASV